MNIFYGRFFYFKKKKSFSKKFFLEVIKVQVI